MITARPYEDLAAHAVLSRLDPMDLIEAEVTRGRATSTLELFADWRAMNAARLASWVLFTGAGEPFAVLGLSHTGQAGVAAAALLARDHRRYRRPLAEAAARMRAGIGSWASETGVRRIEARAWASHPTAAALLAGIGFAPEAAMPGFGPDGREIFVQYAWTACLPEAASHPNQRKDKPCALAEA